MVHAAPPGMLRLSGALGPLQAMAVTGTLTFTLEEHAGGTRLVQTYAVGGHLEGGLAPFAEPVDRVIGSQLHRLAAHLEAARRPKR